ncbi:MAG: ATPase [Paenibacillaceae bacterium]|jgi:putative ATPase|nr:ATPase [Paenibacillaceae bacterium]
MDLFEIQQEDSLEHKPLAERMRPRSLDEYTGQEHLVGKGKSLRVLIESDKVPSMILQGPPSSGKTTLATIISHTTQSNFVKVNAVSLTIAELRRIFDTARDQRNFYGSTTIVMIDEIHALKSNIQEALLPVVENGTIILIGCTTESISHDIIPPLVSRCRVYHLLPFSPDNIRTIVNRALADKERGLGGLGLTIATEALDYLADISNGDVRNVLNALEAAVYASHDMVRIELTHVQEAYSFRLNGITASDRYNLISALCKSMRGGQTDAAVYWLARLLYSGVDPEYIARRLVVHSTEDVGMGNPAALQMALAAKDAVLFVGMPEARMALAQAVIFICESPKSNSAYKAINAALDLVSHSAAYDVPADIRDGSKSYRNPIDNPDTVMEYLPPQLKASRFYKPQNSGVEAKIYAKYRERNRL